MHDTAESAVIKKSGSMCLFLNKQYSFKISYLTSVPVYTMLTYTHSRSPTTDPCISQPER